MLTGLIEALVLLSRRLVLGFLVHVSAHFGWMAPVGDLVLFAGPALVLACALDSGRGWSGALGFFLLPFQAFAALLLMEPGFHKVAVLRSWQRACVQTARMLSSQNEAFERRSGWYWQRLQRCVDADRCGTTVGLRVRERMAIGRLPAAAGNRPERAPDHPRHGEGEEPQPLRLPQRHQPIAYPSGGRGVRFERAFSTAPWTLPSHASLLTGDYPHQLSADWIEPLDRKVPTLAERFSAEGM
jgi:hypothetical protein